MVHDDLDKRYTARAENIRYPLTPPRAGCLTAVALLGVYAATLAPTVTLWDSGEFLSAAKTLGIPHPPGTPLFVVLANAWAKLLWLLPFAAAVNLLSAVATAMACGLLASMLARATGQGGMAVAGGITAGTMLSVWQSATETEVYALALLHGVLVLWIASRDDLDPRAERLVVFLFGVAVSLHLSALATAPAAVWLLAHREGRFDVRRALLPGAAFLVALGVGTMSILPVALAAALAVAVVVAPLGERRAVVAARAGGALALTALGASIVVVMLVRAGHEPGVNQGNPATLDALIDVVGRRQYDVPGLWPRRAPAWLQVANFIQYADWQVAFGLDRWPGASWWRTPWTVALVALAVQGARGHAAAAPRGFRGLALAFAAASLGVIGVLNLRAGPSIGIGILPPDALHEARERDYFFATAFAMWGLWAGAGAVSLARAARSKIVGAALAAGCLIPLVLNYRAADRSHLPVAGLADALGASLLQSAEPNAVLLLAGDNDSYTVWYHQYVNGVRPDVVPVTLPLLAADWYRAELARRHALGVEGGWRGSADALTAIAASAREANRPINVAVSVPSTSRDVLGAYWRLRGMVYVADSSRSSRFSLDQGATADVRDSIRRRVGHPVKDLDPTSRYVQALLDCPGSAMRQVAAASGGATQAGMTYFCNPP
jgi:hypothetical protein